MASKNKIPSWLIYTLVTTVCWGIWGALIEIPEKANFPATLGYITWALTMIPCSVIALGKINWKLETSMRSIILGSLVGLTGAGGQLLLFQALREGPAYLVFPIISLYPILTIAISMIFIGEKANKRQYIGIILSLLAMFLLAQSDATSLEDSGLWWKILTALVFLMWGLQAFVMKFSNNTMKAESIYFYMMLTGLLLTPIAYHMTDFSIDINYGWNGPYLAFGIHILNSVGALTLVYALRYGKAIFVVPLTGLSPVITIVLSLAIYAIWPGIIMAIGMAVAVIAIYLISE